ncbi:hypothetical protein [Carnobacterium maltaromaticum]|uniref:hypothetical protein n=1 Tax=Carnobacterium maltaromaticum TaxID=2751 RepID=UPI0039BDB69D
MTERNYTHKIVMFDVNSAKRVASFKSLENAIMFKKSIDFNKKSRFKKDDANMMFNVDNIVQINPVEVNEK